MSAGQRMLDGLLDWGLQFMRDYGLWAIFLIMFLETALILHGVPTELVMTVGALPLMHSPADLFVVVLVGTAGATLGSQVVYWASYYGGRRFILRYPRIFRMTPARLDRLDRLFERRAGAFLVFACRLVPFLRGFVSIPAGLARMNGWLYFVLSTAGAAVFNLALSGTTYLTHRVPTSLPARAYRAMGDFVVENWVWLAAVGAFLLVGSLLAWRNRHHVGTHYRRHMPAGPGGILVASLLAAVVLAAVLVALPAAWRGLRTTGQIGPFVFLVVLIAAAALLVIARHPVAVLLHKVLRPRGDDPKPPVGKT